MSPDNDHLKHTGLLPDGSLHALVLQRAAAVVFIPLSREAVALLGQLPLLLDLVVGQRLFAVPLVVDRLALLLPTDSLHLAGSGRPLRLKLLAACRLSRQLHVLLPAGQLYGCARIDTLVELAHVLCGAF